MKKMKSLKQQMTTAVSLTLMVMAIAVCAPDQSLAQHRMRNGGSANARQGINVGLGDGSVRQRNNAPRRSSVGGKPFLMPIEDVFSWKNAPRRYGIGGSEAVPTESLSLNFKAAKRNQLRGEEWRDWGVNNRNQAARPDNLSLNGSGVAGTGAIRSAKAQRQSKADEPNRLTDFGPTGSLSVGGNTNARRSHSAAEFLTTEPQGPTHIPARRNSTGSSEQTNSSYSKYELKDVLVSSYSKPKSNLTATTYGRGSGAKSRGKQGH